MNPYAEPVPALEDALRAVWGAPKQVRQNSPYRYRSLSRQGSNSSMISSNYQQNSNGTERQNSYGSSPAGTAMRNGSAGKVRGTNSASQANRIHAELQNSSLTNLNSSRTLFEQHLLQQQQLLLDHQRQALDHFNTAIAEELDRDKKLQGEETDPKDDEIDCSESVSSVDSLEEAAKQRDTKVVTSTRPGSGRPGSGKDDSFRSSGSTSSLLHSSLSGHSNVAVVAPSVVTSPTETLTNKPPQKEVKPGPYPSDKSNLYSTDTISQSHPYQQKLEPDHIRGVVNSNSQNIVVQHLQTDNMAQWVTNQNTFSKAAPATAPLEPSSFVSQVPNQPLYQPGSSCKSAWVLHDTPAASPNHLQSQQQNTPASTASNTAPNASHYTNRFVNGTTTTEALNNAANSRTNQNVSASPVVSEYRAPEVPPASRTSVAVAPPMSVPTDNILLSHTKPAIAENSYSSIQAAMYGGHHNGGFSQTQPAAYRPPTEPVRPAVPRYGVDHGSSTSLTSQTVTTAGSSHPLFTVAVPKTALPRPVKTDTNRTHFAGDPTLQPRTAKSKIPLSTYSDDNIVTPPKAKKEVKSILRKSPSPPRERVGLKGVGYSRAKQGAGPTSVSASVRDSLEIARQHMAERQVRQRNWIVQTSLVSSLKPQPKGTNGYNRWLLCVCRTPERRG